MKKILWIEDYIYEIQFLLRPFEDEGYKIDHARSADEGYLKAKNWKQYSMIMIDIRLKKSDGISLPINEEINFLYGDNRGLDIIDWLLNVQKADIPIIILTIIHEKQLPRLYDQKNILYISKRGLLPRELKENVLSWIASLKRGEK